MSVEDERRGPHHEVAGDRQLFPGQVHDEIPGRVAPAEVPDIDGPLSAKQAEPPLHQIVADVTRKEGACARYSRARRTSALSDRRPPGASGVPSRPLPAASWFSR